MSNMYDHFPCMLSVEINKIKDKNVYINLQQIQLDHKCIFEVNNIYHIVTGAICMKFL